MDGAIITEKLLNVIARRAKAIGFRRQDVEDAVQDVAVSILEFEYVPEKWQGLGQDAALDILIARRLTDLFRRHIRRERFESRLPKFNDIIEPKDQEMPVDLRELVASLSAREQAVCQAIEESASLDAAAQAVGCSTEQLQDILAGMRRRFADAGMGVSA